MPPERGLGLLRRLVGDTLFAIGARLGVDPWMLCARNLAMIPGCGKQDFGRNPANTLQVGMVLTYPVSECKPRPGYWDCYTLPTESKPQALNYITETVPSSMLPSNMGYGPDLLYLYNQRTICSHVDGAGKCSVDGTSVALVYAGMQLRMPVRHCFPDEHSACVAIATIIEEAPVADYDFNPGTLQRYRDNQMLIGMDMGKPGVEVKVPRFFAKDDPYPLGLEGFCSSAFECGSCRPRRGETLCYKVQPRDTLELVARQFDLDWQRLCALNQFTNCSHIGWEDSFLQIPLTSPSVVV